jgi:hypothetical protein
MKTHVLLVLCAFACSHGLAQSIGGHASAAADSSSLSSRGGVIPGGVPSSEAIVEGSFGVKDATAVDLAIALAKLQPQLERIASLLAVVNRGGLELPPAQVTVPPATVSPPPETAPGSGERLSDNRSANHSGRAGSNLSSNVSVPAGSAVNPPPSGPLIATASGVMRAGTAPIIVSKPVPPATYRSLASLEEQIRQVLPVVAAVNKNDTFRSLASTVSPAGPAAFGTQSNTPTPTGRTNAPISAPQVLRLR